MRLFIDTSMWYAADLETAWQIGLAYRDQDFSIVDRTSFAVMRRLGIECAASLDDHFAVFRFERNRRRLSLWPLGRVQWWGSPLCPPYGKRQCSDSCREV